MLGRRRTRSEGTRWPRGYIVAAALAGIALGGAGVTGAMNGVKSDGDEAARSARPGVLRAENDLLAQILRGMRESRIVTATVGPPPEPFDQSPGSVWVFYKIRAADDVDFLRGYWQALVVSGVLRDASAQRHLPPLYGHTFTMIAPDGTEHPQGASVIGLEPQAMNEASQGEVVDIVGRSARDGGVTLLELSISRPLGHVAPELVVRAQNPRVFISDLGASVAAVVGALNGRNEVRPGAEGAYLEIRDEQNRLVAISAYSARTGHGAGTIGPAYRDAVDLSAGGWGGHTTGPPRG